MTHELRGINSNIIRSHEIEISRKNEEMAKEIEELKSQLKKYQMGWEPGHFYSPIPSIEEIKSKEELIFKRVNEDLEDIDLNYSAQLQLLSEFQKFYDYIPFSSESDLKTKNLRYSPDNSNFSYGEAVILYSMMRHLKPQRIVEIGSGYSSALILDVNDLFFSKSISCSFIEPYPKLLLSLCRKSDLEHIDVIHAHAQSVETEIFSSLEEGDILFIDSTHVSKIDSDVNHIFFRILPSIPSGVYIHFHDIYYPFEYPQEWIYQGRAWNEAYLLRAFLQNNEKYEIIFFNSYLHNLYAQTFESSKMNAMIQNPGSSIWIRKK